jgi:membrane protease YdiL (CAAX protease family)
MHTGSPVPASGVDEFGSPAPASLSKCWRCDKSVVATQEVCPYCRAALVTRSVRRTQRRDAELASLNHPLMKVLIAYFIFLGVSVVLGLMIHFAAREKAVPNANLVQRQFDLILFFELLDSVLVIGVLFWCGRPVALRARSTPLRVMTWIYAVPVLSVLLGLNVGYHRLITDYLSLPVGIDEILLANGLSGLVMFACCLQPAVIEELFFRYLALGNIRELIGDHGAVLVSAVMFGMAHIYVPLSIPYLVVVGVVLGYARLYSGSLLLPMLMHFGHNAAVLLIDYFL